MSTLLSLDLSTTSTGWSTFDTEDHSLLEYGIIKPQVKGITKLKYPEKQLRKIISISEQIEELVKEVEPDQILIEEVNKGINRIAQKSLDSLHFLVLYFLAFDHKELVVNSKFMDSNGAVGWRTKLKLSTTPYKNTQKNRTQKWKKAAEEIVNSTYGTNFDVWGKPGHSDICDSIAMGIAYLLDEEDDDSNTK
jgi:hypothetical protein